MLKLKSLKLANPVRCGSQLKSFVDENGFDLFLYNNHPFFPAGTITITDKKLKTITGTSIHNTVEFHYDQSSIEGDASGAEPSEPVARRGRQTRSN